MRNQASTGLWATLALEADVQRGGASMSDIASERVTSPILRAYSKLSKRQYFIDGSESTVSLSLSDLHLISWRAYSQVSVF